MPVLLRQPRSLYHVRGLERTLLYSVFIPVALYAFALSTGLAEMTGRGPRGDLIGSSRGIPLYLLLVLAVALSAWRYGPRKRAGKLICIIAMGTVLFTLARTASLLAFGFFAIRKVNPRRKWQLITAATVVGVVAFYAVTYIPILHQRFFFWEDWSISQGLRGFNTAGRNIMWPATFSSAMESPLTGRGLGTARVVVADLFGGRDMSEYHPHNEYLQVFHDLGLLGLALVVMAWGFLLVRTWQKWEHAKDPYTAKWNMAAALSVGVIMTSSLTDNTLHYPFVLVTAMTVIGVAEYFNQNGWMREEQEGR